MVFDAAKEHKIVISTNDGHGDTFTVLGVDFDNKLTMGAAIHNCAVQASWKLRTIQRTRRFHVDSDMLVFFKAHILSFIEYRTAAFYHAATTHLSPLDRIFSGFLT